MQNSNRVRLVKRPAERQKRATSRYMKSQRSKEESTSGKEWIFAAGGDAGCGVGGLSEQSLYDKSKEATGEAVHAYGWGKKEDDE